MSIISRLLGFNLQDLPNFPYDEWQDLQSTYNELEYWYNGDLLQETVTDKNSGKSTEKYPIKINPLKGTARKHASTVFGQNVDSIRFGGLPVQFIPDLDKEQKEKAKTIKDALLKVYTDNKCGAKLFSNCIISQYLGGSVLTAKWLPKDKTIEINNPSPKEFLGVPKGSDYWTLSTAWIVREISESVAKDYGYTPKMGEKDFYYIEEWHEDSYKIMVNGQVINFEGTDLPMEGENVFKKVPIVYIPHLRETGFYGEPIVTEAVKGIIKELNLRWADIGDAVSEDSHSFVAVRNIRGTIKILRVDGRPIVDLGSNPGISANEVQPDMMSVRTQSASAPMITFGDNLYGVYRREVNHPAVADGEDEGSQRSSLTLTTRMWPLVSEAEWERLFLTVGLVEFNKILLTIMAEKNINEITEDMIDVPQIVQWQPMLPRDREALVQEAGVRASNDIGSKKHIMGLFGDVQDPEQMFDEVIDEKKEIGKVEVQNSPFGNTSSGTANNKSATANTTPGKSAD